MPHLGDYFKCYIDGKNHTGWLVTPPRTAEVQNSRSAAAYGRFQVQFCPPKATVDVLAGDLNVQSVLVHSRYEYGRDLLVAEYANGLASSDDIPTAEIRRVVCVVVSNYALRRKHHVRVSTRWLEVVVSLSRGGSRLSDGLSSGLSDRQHHWRRNGHSSGGGDGDSSRLRDRDSSGRSGTLGDRLNSVRGGGLSVGLGMDLMSDAVDAVQGSEVAHSGHDVLGFLALCFGPRPADLIVAKRGRAVGADVG
ncbi:hypothetical protein OH76DRAFT_1423855 [Lentinus brumalis]|uniref:Uncharacterized protein n=1 Tax=Lentinus brumalis TaxID=2498619 RepID=A0A371CIU8_9APHY|nr:hypothetical protein OH76DRAFT_1423855 [Polyporus brumalis]